jgi:hypothetical protein
LECFHGPPCSLSGVRNATAIVFITPRTPPLPLRNT